MKWPYHLLRISLGWLVFRCTGHTPAWAYQSMVWLFCATGGRSNSLLARLLALRRASFDAAGILPGQSSARFQSILAELKDRGCVVMPGLIPEELCDRLLSHLLECEGTYTGDHMQSLAGEQQRYDRNAPLAAKFSISVPALLASEDVCRLVCDESLLAIAQAYLGGGPVITGVTAWWTAALGRGADSKAAQLFHFDLDRPRWLKMFLYLTDVSPSNGPHVFIPGTHRDGGIPEALLRRGYSRINDDEVGRFFPTQSWQEMTGAKGTVILEDTRGLHKGKELLAGDRLMFEIEYASSLFGATRPLIEYERSSADRLGDTIARFPSVYRAFVSRRSPLEK